MSHITHHRCLDCRYVVSGITNKIYDFATSSWSSGANPPHSSDHYGAVTVGNLMYLVGSLKSSLSRGLVQWYVLPNLLSRCVKLPFNMYVIF
jgi:hypothetical protein